MTRRLFVCLPTADEESVEESAGNSKTANPYTKDAIDFTDGWCWGSRCTVGSSLLLLLLCTSKRGRRFHREHRANFRFDRRREYVDRRWYFDKAALHPPPRGQKRSAHCGEQTAKPCAVAGSTGFAPWATSMSSPRGPSVLAGLLSLLPTRPARMSTPLLLLLVLRRRDRARKSRRALWLQLLR